MQFLEKELSIMLFIEFFGWMKILIMLQQVWMVLGGLFGTSILSIEKYFIKNGFPTKSSSKKEDYENIAKGSDVLILTIYNNKEDITDQVHTIAITKKNGKYFVHNNGSNSALTGYDSITDVLKKINSGKAKDIFLVGINKK